MPIPSPPSSFIPQPFAQQGNFDVIPDTTTTPGRASFSGGFPQVTQLPLRDGGIAPNRMDFNGLFHLLTAFGFWQQSGGQWSYATGLNYTQPNVVYHDEKLWWCLRENGPDSINGPHEPGTDESYWIELLTALGKMAGGGIGGGFNTMTVLTSSQTWTAPVAGTYKVTCIGGGGAGGRGGGRSVGGGGGGAGSETRFGSFLSALGGSGGGGGTGVPRDAGAGGGGGAGEVSTAYARLTAGQVVAVSVGSGAQRNTLFSTTGRGGFGDGPSGGPGGAGNRLGGGGAPGAGSGGNGIPDHTQGPLPGRPPTGGSGGINGTGYGGGGGGGGGGDRYGGDCGGAAKDGAERGGEAYDFDTTGYGGAGGRGAVILEYYAREA